MHFRTSYICNLKQWAILGGAEQGGFNWELFFCYASVTKQNSKLCIKKTLSIKNSYQNPDSITWVDGKTVP